MYSVRLGFDIAKERINKLLNHGYHAEALLTAVFTFEKTIHRTLKQLMISAGFRSKDARKLGAQLQGFKKQKEIWCCFDPQNRALPEVIDDEYWQYIARAVEMRNNLVHGERIYELSECKKMAENVLVLLSQTIKKFESEYDYDGWKKVSIRKKSRLHSDPKVKL